MAAISPVVVLSDLMLFRILQNPILRNSFPFLSSAYRMAEAAGNKTGGCKCRRRAVIDYQSLRNAVGNLPSQEKVRLKNMLNVRQVVVDIKSGGGRKRVKF